MTRTCDQLTFVGAPACDLYLLVHSVSSCPCGAWASKARFRTNEVFSLSENVLQCNKSVPVGQAPTVQTNGDTHAHANTRSKVACNGRGRGVRDQTPLPHKSGAEERGRSATRTVLRRGKLVVAARVGARRVGRWRRRRWRRVRHRRLGGKMPREGARKPKPWQIDGRIVFPS